MMSADPYDVLGVSRDDSIETIKQKFRRLRALFHPDRTQGYAEGVRDEAAAQWQRINDAYEAIMHERESGYTGSGRREHREARNETGGQRSGGEKQPPPNNPRLPVLVRSLLIDASRVMRSLYLPLPGSEPSPMFKWLARHVSLEHGEDLIAIWRISTDAPGGRPDGMAFTSRKISIHRGPPIPVIIPYTNFKNFTFKTDGIDLDSTSLSIFGCRIIVSWNVGSIYWRSPAFRLSYRVDECMAIDKILNEIRALAP
jgi:hypothetical protein